MQAPQAGRTSRIGAGNRRHRGCRRVQGVDVARVIELNDGTAWHATMTHGLADDELARFIAAVDRVDVGY